MIAKLLGASLREVLHVVLRAEVQAAGWTRFDASRLEPLADAIGAKSAFVNAFGF